MIPRNEADPPPHNSHLFMLRMWPEDLGSGQTDWRGKVQHVNSGEARYFRDWAILKAFVEGLIRRIDKEGPLAREGEETDRASRET